MLAKLLIISTKFSIASKVPALNPNSEALVNTSHKLIYADGLYKLVIKDSDDDIIETRDNLQYFYISSTIITTTEISASDYRDWETDRKSTRLNSSHLKLSRMPSSA